MMTGNNNVDPMQCIYMEKSCHGKKAHPPTQATLGEPTFPTLPCKNW